MPTATYKAPKAELSDIVSVSMPKEFSSQLNEFLKANSYTNRAEFVRECIRNAIDSRQNNEKTIAKEYNKNEIEKYLDDLIRLESLNPSFITQVVIECCEKRVLNVSYESFKYSHIFKSMEILESFAVFDGTRFNPLMSANIIIEILIRDIFILLRNKVYRAYYKMILMTEKTIKDKSFFNRKNRNSFIDINFALTRTTFVTIEEFYDDFMIDHDLLIGHYQSNRYQILHCLMQIGNWNNNQKLAWERLGSLLPCKDNEGCFDEMKILFTIIADWRQSLGQHSI